MTLNIPAPSSSDSPRQAQWNDVRALFPIYLSLAKYSDLEVPFPREKWDLPEEPSLEMLSKAPAWFDGMDRDVPIHKLRHFMQSTSLNTDEHGLRALSQRYLRKTAKTATDRDKIDFLLVQFFVLCAPAQVYHKQIELSDVAHVMEPVLGKVDSTPLPWTKPFEDTITALKGFHSLKDMLALNFVEEGRKVKETAGNSFYEPSSLLAFVRFNFMVRRTLIELMHADLAAIRSGLNYLAAAGNGALDCRTFGLTATEPIAKIQEIAHAWKNPFQSDYTERSVNEGFAKLLSLRKDVDRAVEAITGQSEAQSKPAPTPETASQTKQFSEKLEPAEIGTTSPSAAPTTEAPAKAQRPSAPSEPQPELTFEMCLEQIWEQLIATPPERGRSMTTVKIRNARILLSSWEVSAFVSKDDPAADDLRRAVVARALVNTAVQTMKDTAETRDLSRALSVARIEVSRLQERVDVAKEAKDTEAAVNLGISTKRLLSALDEAEKL